MDMPIPALFLKLGETRIVLGLSCVAALLYSSFSFGLPPRYNSPDETANAYFARRVAQGDELAAPARLNIVAGEPLVLPRSTQVVGYKLAPASFLGLPLLLGFLGYLFGAWLIPYVTALGAIVGLSALYLAVRELFDRRAAALATLLTAFLPAYWYYHARGFFHNALFFDLLMLATWFAVKLMRKKHWWYYLATGLAGGAALALRTSEFFWVVGGALIWFTLAWRELKLRYLWLIVAGAVVAFTPVLVTNFSIYGQLFSVGYNVGEREASGALAAATSLIAELILPFGFNPGIIGSTTLRYLWQLTWWWALLAAAGLVYAGFRFRELSLNAGRYLAAALVASLWLVVLYGSWLFNDNPDPTAVTLGTSYVRYWLPLYVFLLVPASWALARLWAVRLGRALVIGIVGGFVVLSVALVIFEPQEGLVAVRRNVQRFTSIAAIVEANTPARSVIVTDGITDKLFWPDRQVLVSDEPVQYLGAIRRLLEADVPVYRWHPTWGPQDINYLNSRKLKVEHLAIEPVVVGLDGYSLYRFRLR